MRSHWPQAVRVRRCKLLNDLEAAAFGMLFLADSEKVVIQTGKQHVRRANLAVIAAGTGLGEGMLYWDGDHYDPIASEGGHTDFAPQSDLEIELLRYLQRKFGGHVSYERIVSGPGIFNVYQFLRDTGLEAEPANLAAELAGGDPSATIARHASSVAICRRTMEVFLRIYGAEAGNLALKCLATGGVFVAGGVAAKNLEWMTHSAFAEGFNDKGRFRALCEAIPITVSTNQRAPLHGAAHYAERLV